jgi:hypothetical protein
MNFQNKESERRRAPRVKQQIPLKLRYNDYDLVVQTHNISTLGAYCTVNRYIIPFSLLSINLLLPLKGRKRKRICNVHCQGVVVRTERNPLNAKEYNIAIYFEKLKQADKAKLSQYIREHL